MTARRTDSDRAMENGPPLRWREVDALLDAALDASASPSSPSQPEPSDATPAALSEARRLLGFRAKVRNFLETPGLELAGDLLGVAPTPAGFPDGSVPERVGPYRIVREAGRGGMATVFLAERDDPELRQRVAIKLIRGGFDRSALVGRFLRERQILASLEHPGIARLLDGGVNAEGLPWFAMEFVAGEPITLFCERRRLGIDQRLELFLQVCDAVEYAHQRLVVHRDLKPSNILVGEEGTARADGRVKLLDFGIARLLTPVPEGGEAGLTRPGLLPLTPQYASPEQLRGEPVSTSSDVYQLGLLLYEMLTGSPPYDLSVLPPYEAQRVVFEREPEPPSAVVGSGAARGSGAGDPGAPPTGFAEAPARLRRRLRGDLDTICLTALRKSPERRYGSVERLGDDVRRHLRREPVSARPDTVLYRSGRFIRRHTVAVASAALVFVLLCASAGAVAVQSARTARERDRAEQATAFIADLFATFEPLEARGSTVLVPDVLRRGVERARVELAGEPLLRAKVLEVIADGFQLQGLHADAEPLLGEVLDTRLAVLGPDHLDVARSRIRLADLRYERGDYGAEALFREALATFAGRLDARAPELVRTRIGLALTLRGRGGYAAADSMLHEILVDARAGPGLEVDVPIVLVFLGKLRTREGDFDEAERLLAEALGVRLDLLGREHPAFANALDALGELRLAQGDPEGAERYFLEALSVRDALYDDAHTDVASGLTYLARARIRRGDLAAADTLLVKALPIFRRAFGDGSPDVAEALEYLGAVRAGLGDLAAADSLYARALLLWERMGVERTHDRRATLSVRVGALRLAEGDLAGAMARLAEGLALRREELPDGHWRIAEAESLFGACLSRLGRVQEAGPLLAGAYADLKGVRGEDDPLTRQALAFLNEHSERAGEDVPGAAVSGTLGAPPPVPYPTLQRPR